jgi:hypothetical protein
VQPDPVISRLAADVRSLTGQVRTQQGVLDAQRKAEHDARVAAVQRGVEALQDKPHFDELRPLMSALMAQGQAGTVAEAYEMAVNANPKTREAVQERERAQQETARQAKAHARSEEARRAAVINIRSSTASQVTPKTMDDTLKEIARRRYG